MKIRTLIVLVIAAAVAVAAWLLTHTEADAVRRVFASIEREAAREDGETTLQSLAKAKTLAGHIVEGCEISLDGFMRPRDFSRDAFAAGVATARSQHDFMAVKFSELYIEVNGVGAIVKGNADGFDVYGNGGRLMFDATMTKCDDGVWRFSRIKAFANEEL